MLRALDEGGPLHDVAQELEACCYSRQQLAALAAAVAGVLDDLASPPRMGGMLLLRAALRRNASADVLRWVASTSDLMRNLTPHLGGAEQGTGGVLGRGGRRQLQQAVPSYLDLSKPPGSPLPPTDAYPPQLLVPMVFHVMLYRWAARYRRGACAAWHAAEPMQAHRPVCVRLLCDVQRSASRAAIGVT